MLDEIPSKRGRSTRLSNSNVCCRMGLPRNDGKSKYLFVTHIVCLKRKVDVREETLGYRKILK